MQRVFIVNISTLNRPNISKFHKIITNANGVVFWFHYIENSWLLITENDVSTHSITNFIKPQLPNTFFMVIELDKNDLLTSNGWLPPEAWEWISTYVPTVGQRK